MNNFSFPYKDNSEPFWSESEAKDVDILYKWMQEQPQYSHYNKLHAHAFLHAFYFDIENAKISVKKYTDLRSSHLNIFGNRDPMLQEVQKCFDTIQMISLPNKTKDGYIIHYYRFSDPEPKKLNHANALKALNMFLEVDFSLSGPQDGYVLVFDMKGITMAHLTRLQFNLVRFMSNYYQGGLPYRLKSVIMLNTVPFLSHLLVLLKPFIKSEIFSLIKWLNSPTPEEHIDLELLPEDFGGPLPSIDSFYKDVRKRIETEYRDWLIASSLEKTTGVGESSPSSSFKKIEFD